MTWAWSSAAPGVTHHGTDTHREDPLADLNLSIDGQRTSYQALRMDTRNVVHPLHGLDPHDPMD